FAYFDIKKRCEDCKKPFIFSSTEQHKWYEEYKFWVQSEPKQCLSCRRMRRQRAKTNKVLALAISELDPKDPLQLDRISELYLAIGSTRKAADYLASAKNRAEGLVALETLKKRRMK
ncbi:zinc-ribbon domain containing protein, partial [bacterium]|nr:zinc-ribbon domain containing protein [bacterium]